MFRSSFFYSILLTMCCLSSGVANAKDLGKGGGFNVCEDAIANEYQALSGKGIRTKMIKIKHTPKRKTRSGITHVVTLKVSGVAENSFKVLCTVRRNEDTYSADLEKLSK